MIVKLREVMKKNNVSIYWLSKQTGITTATISKLCDQKTSGIRFYVLDKICDALNCEVSDILERENGDTVK